MKKNLDIIYEENREQNISDDDYYSAQCGCGFSDWSSDETQRKIDRLRKESPVIIDKGCRYKIGDKIYIEDKTLSKKILVRVEAVFPQKSRILVRELKPGTYSFWISYIFSDSEFSTHRILTLYPDRNEEE